AGGSTRGRHAEHLGADEAGHPRGRGPQHVSSLHQCPPCPSAVVGSLRRDASWPPTLRVRAALRPDSFVTTQSHTEEGGTGRNGGRPGTSGPTDRAGLP